MAGRRQNEEKAGKKKRQDGRRRYGSGDQGRGRRGRRKRKRKVGRYGESERLTCLSERNVRVPAGLKIELLLDIRSVEVE